MSEVKKLQELLKNPDLDEGVKSSIKVRLKQLQSNDPVEK